MSEQNKATIRRIREQAVGRTGADLDILDGLYAPNYRYHGGAAFGEMEGADSFKMLLQGMSSVLADYRERVLDQLAEGNKVATRLVGSGQVVGELLGVPGDGKTISAEALSIASFNEQGQVEEEWVLGDTYAFLQQLGAV